MSDKAPLVSVVIPTYNRSAFVVKAVESVLDQTYTDYELIVVDDGSTDSTKDNLNKYGDRIICIHQSNSGVSAARNAGITVSRGEWLAFLDSDDEWKPDYLAKQIKHANMVPGLCMQSANCLITYHNDGLPQTYFEVNGAIPAFKGRDYLLIEEPFAFVVVHQPWQVGSIIVRRDAAIKAGLFSVNQKFWQGKRVFLTGHTGFKGSWLGAWLTRLGAHVTGFALPPQTTPSHFALLPKNYESIEGDIRDLEIRSFSILWGYDAHLGHKDFRHQN